MNVVLFISLQFFYDDIFRSKIKYWNEDFPVPKSNFPVPKSNGAPAHSGLKK